MPWNIAIAANPRRKSFRFPVLLLNQRARRASEFKNLRGGAALLPHLPEGAGAIAPGDEQIISPPKAGL
jgi:hypothetical protein